MVVRKDGWRVIASVAVCLAATGALSAAMARDIRPIPRADIPFPQDTMTTGTTQPTLVWGGPVPPEPIPGEAPVYVPSQSVVPSMPQPQPQFAPPEEFGAEPRRLEPQRVYQPDPEPEFVDEPEPRYAPAEEIYRQSEPGAEAEPAALDVDVPEPPAIDQPDAAYDPEPAYEEPAPEPARRAKRKLSDEDDDFAAPAGPAETPNDDPYEGRPVETEARGAARGERTGGRA